MKKLIISILFGLCAFSAFAKVKVVPTNDFAGDYQIFNIICDSYTEYEERAESFIKDENVEIIDRYEEELILQIIYKDCICIDGE